MFVFILYNNFSSAPTFGEFVLITFIEVLLLQFLMPKFSLQKHYLSVIFVNIVKIAGISLLLACRFQSFIGYTVSENLVALELFILGFILSTIVYEHDLDISRNEIHIFAFEVSFISSALWLLIIYPFFHPLRSYPILYAASNISGNTYNPIVTITSLLDLPNFITVVSQNFHLYYWLYHQ